MTPKNIVFDLGHVIFDYDPAHARDLLKTDPAKTFNIIEAGLQLLQKCRAQLDTNGNRRHKLFVLSNATPNSYQVMTEYFPHIFELFDEVMTSAHVGMSKPDARIYHHFLQTHKLTASDCIFIDDKEPNVLAARAAGMHGILCKNFDTVEQELKKLQIIE
jgi:FMN phosphatase YigB (HAD superfamily)